VRRGLLAFVVAAAAFPSLGFAQVADAVLPGGTPPGASPAVFARGLVSGAGEEYGVAVTEDWSEIYFTRLAGERSTIMRTRRIGTEWTSATPVSFSGTYNDSHPWLADGGARLYFVSRRPCPGSRQALNVWVAERSEGDWTPPRSLGAPVTDQTVHAPSLSLDGTIYATGLIRLRRADGRYLPAERLSPPVFGSHPAVAPDQSFIVFAARREGGAGGTDLYVVFARPDGSWTTPSSLGPAVDTRHVESSPTLSSDGRFLFFSRQGEVWWVDASVIEAARPKSPRTER
jgi:hypothetical protein